VSFDPTVVGGLQGHYLADHEAKGTNVIVINGDQTADTGREFKAGAMAALNPAFQSGQLKLGYTADTPLFDPSKAQQETEAALTKLGDKVGGVLVANDGMAAGVVAALTAQRLAGSVLVTGQDATVAGLQRILTGTQSMTVYKSIPQEAQTAAKVAVGLLEGNPDAVSSVAKTTTDNGAGQVPSVLLTPQVVTKSNVSIVVQDGAATWADLCTGIPARDCPQHA
jgi:D-xylose transport system substrate-binding protein